MTSYCQTQAGNKMPETRNKEYILKKKLYKLILNFSYGFFTISKRTNFKNSNSHTYMNKNGYIKKHFGNITKNCFQFISLKLNFRDAFKKTENIQS